jgi:hypothetical protein
MALTHGTRALTITSRELEDLPDGSVLFVRVALLEMV